MAAGLVSGLAVGIAGGIGLLGTGVWGSVGLGALGGGSGGVVAEGLFQLATYGSIVDPGALLVAGTVGAAGGAVFAGIGYGVGRGLQAAAIRRLAAQDVAYRYVGNSEAAVIQNSRIIPNIDRLGYPKQVFTSTNLYTSTKEAEVALQIGRMNPTGPTSPPTYRVTYSRNAARYSYAGNVQGGTGIELVTDQLIPIIRIDRLRGGY